MTERNQSGRWALLVAIGILLSRIAGLIRDRVFAHYFGNSDAADAFRAALRIPNFLQNLFGEGVLSASFIPVYTKLLAEGAVDDARRVAGAIATLLGLTVSILVALGVATTPWLIEVITPGFSGQKRELTQRLVAILFPGTGLLVLSAWCLGILNSHRQFFLSYVAPVLWNLAIIVALLAGGAHDQYALAEIVAWGAVAGSGLQWLIQLPKALALNQGLRLSLGLGSLEVRTVVSNFLPAMLGRGVVQISAYIDAMIASLLPSGALAALSYAQTLYLLPVSLFGMSNAIAELPEMSSVVGEQAAIAAQLRTRLQAALRRIAFFIVPSTVALLMLGNVIAAAVYQTGHFTYDDARYVWSVLAGASLGLLASTLGRLYASTCYALRDTRTPMRFALVRVAAAAGLGYQFSLHLPAMFDLDQRWGVAGLAIASSVAGWLEFVLLRRAISRRVGATPVGNRLLSKLWLAAGLAGITAGEIEWVLPHLAPIPMAVIVLGAYGLLYLFACVALGIDQGQALVQRGFSVLRRFRR